MTEGVLGAGPDVQEGGGGAVVLRGARAGKEEAGVLDACRG